MKSLQKQLFLNIWKIWVIILVFISMSAPLQITTNAQDNFHINPTNQSKIVFQSTQNQAIDNAANIGFSDCQFKTAQTDGISKCFRQILQFSFVVAIFLVVFRIAITGIQQFNPDQSVDAQKETVGLIRDLVIGFILIGIPGVFLGLLNAGLLNLEFLGLKGFSGGDASRVDTSGINPSAGGKGGSGGGNSNSGGATGGNSAVSAQGVTPQNFKDALDKLKQNGTDQQAATTVKKVADLQNQCNSNFVPASIANDCKNLQTAEYQAVLGGLTDSLRSSLGITNAEKTNFSGSFTSQYPMDIQQSNNPIKNGNCVTNMFTITFKKPTGNKIQSAYTTDCGATPADTSGLVKNVSGNLSVGTISLPAGTTFNREIVYL
jgi:hypothetical protein